MSKHRYSQKVIIRKDAIKKDGTAAVSLQVFINSKRKVIPLGFSCRVGDFVAGMQQIKIDKKKMGTVRQKELQALQDKYNAIIHSKVALAKNIFANAIMTDRVLNRKVFAEKFSSEALQKEFHTYIRKAIEKEVGVRSAGTITAYRQMLNHLIDFRREIFFSEVNYEFIDEFHKYLKRKKLGTNTIAKQHKNLKKFINLGINQGIPLANPYLNFKIKKSRTNRTFLELEEVKALITMYQSNALAPHLQEQLRAFLFQCMTGLRDSDVRALTVENLGTNEIIFTPIKTRYSLQMHKIPLNNFALQLIEDKPIAFGKLFSLPVTQEYNEQLKVLARFANIKKNLTTHVGRHTFATSFLTLGGKVETLRDILAHASIETTMIYVHITPQRKRDEIANFDFFFKKKSDAFHATPKQ